jgi:glycosyltransferase involved in cell wall biosynthesis
MTANGPVPVSVVIAARDEEDQIGACVASVSWAAEVIVVENDSGDETVRRAQDAGAIVFRHPFRSIGGQRNAAIARAAHDWILVLDADERATAALGAEIGWRVASPGPDAYRVPRRNFFLGREIRHGGWDRDRPVRLFRRHLRYDERAVHEGVRADAPPGLLDETLHHVPYASLDEYFAKLDRYSRDWARQHHGRGRRASVWTLLGRPPARFFSMYVLRGGWRDGAHGLVLAVLASVSVAAKYARLWALQRTTGGAARGD